MIQNAEDNFYTENNEPSLTIKLLKNDITGMSDANGTLIIENNEIGFLRENVEAICAVGKTTKIENQGFIGEKGIGFKSVFRVTSCPFIFSNGYQFSLPEEHTQTGLGYIVPNWVKDIHPSINTSLTSIILPLDKKDFGFDIVKQMLNEIEPETILFLSKLKEIKVIIDSEKEFTIIKAEVDKTNVQILTNKSGSEEVFEFRVFQKTFKKPDNIEHEKRRGIQSREVTIAFPVGANKCNAGKLFAYLPVRFDTGFPFIINADFILPSTREDIQDTSWNRDWLLPCVGELLLIALPLLKEPTKLYVQFLDSLAKSVHEIQVDSLYYPIGESLKNAFSTMELLPTNNGSYVSTNNAKLASADWLRKLLQAQQLKLLYGKEVQWIHSDITERGAFGVLWKYLQDDLKIEVVTPDGFARKISLPFLSAQADEWFIDFYRYLSVQEALWRAPRWQGDTGGILRSEPIIRLDNGTLEDPFKSDGKTPNVFLPPPESTDFPVVKRSILEDEQALTFLKNLGLKEPDIFDDILKNVFPKYKKNEVKLTSEIEHIEDMRKIVRAITSDSMIKEVVEVAKQTPFLKCINDSDGSLSWCKPEALCVDMPYKDTGLFEISVIHQKKLIWDGYALLLDDLQLIDFTSFLKSIGVMSKLEISSLNIWKNPNLGVLYEGLWNKRYTHTAVDEDYTIDCLNSYICHESVSASKLIWNCLISADKKVSKARYRPNQEYSTREVDSQLVHHLKNCAWIPDKLGEFRNPQDMTRDDLRTDFPYDDRNGLLTAIGFGEKAKKATAEYQKRDDIAKSLGFDSADDIDKITKRKKEDPEGYNFWLNPPAKPTPVKPTFPVRAVSNPDRRRERLHEQIAAAPSKVYEERKRRVRATSGALEPKTYLREQYTNDGLMVCQICKEEMPFRKRNKKHYFEKKEVLSRKYLLKELEAQYLALCPLCAAKYEEFVISDKGAMAKLHDTIINTDSYDISISLGKEETSIRFVETHYFDLKQILANTW